MTEKAQDQKKVIKPSKWTLAQGWRKVEPSEIGKAEEARLYLLGLRFYPSGITSNNPGWDRAEINDRYALHQMIDELIREDLQAVFKLCRLMVAFPEGAQEAAQIQEKRDNDFIDWAFKTYPSWRKRKANTKPKPTEA